MQQRRFAKHLRQSMTEAELRLWFHLRAHRLGGHKFKRQVLVGPYIVDFLHHGARLVVEADGGQHNGSAGDAERDAWLRRHGYRVLRFWNHEILQNTPVVLGVIWEALGTEPSPPAPLPPAGEGSKALSPGPSPAGGRGENQPAPGPSPACGRGVGERERPNE